MDEDRLEAQAWMTQQFSTSSFVAGQLEVGATLTLILQSSSHPYPPIHRSMQLVALANAATFVLTALLIAATLLRSPPARNVRNLLLLLLLGLLIWSGGAVWRAVAPDHGAMIAAHNLVFLGVTLVPTAWILLAAAATRFEFFETRPDAAAWIVVPAVLVYMGWLTNDLHDRFAHIDFMIFERGPFFWAMIAWAFVCSASGSAFFLQRARSMALADERRGAYLLMTAAVIPQVVSATYLFKWIGWPFDPTPAALGISSALLYPVILRLRTLEDLPLVRRDVIDQLADAVLIADPNEHVVDYNPAAQKLFAHVGTIRGLKLGELIERFQARSEEDDLVVTNCFEHLMEADITSVGGQTFQINHGLVPGSQGRSLGSYVILRDVSQDRRAEQAIRRAMRLESVGLLASGVAHELNNPLAFVRANLSYLTKGLETINAAARSVGIEHTAEPTSKAAAAAECLEEMPEVLCDTARGVDRVADIVANMQSLSQTRSLARQPVDLATLAKEAWQGAALENSVPCPCEMRMEANLPTILASGPDLMQALMNLMLNARQAAAANSAPLIRLSIESDIDDGTVVLTVEDNGPGIAADHIDRVFDPFFTTREPGEGTGLGLAIAFDIIREHGGRIGAGQGALGGARLSVHLPVPITT